MFYYNVLLLYISGAQVGDEVKQRLAILRDTEANDQETRARAHEELIEMEEIEKLVDDVVSGLDESDMGSFWVDFMEMCDPLFMNAHACHAVEFDEFVVSLRAFLPWMLTYDKNKYGRALPDFWTYLVNLPPEKYEFMRENFALSLTGNPYSGVALDLWIEVTMNKGSKVKAGWLSILKNEKQLLVHSRNVNNIARIRAAQNKAAKKKNLKFKHVECRPKRMKTDEQMVQNITACFEEFDCDPFDLEKPALRTMVSGVSASEELVQDFKSAKNDGEQALQTFLQERVYSKTKSIHERMKRNNRKTFTSVLTDKTGTGQTKIKITEIEQAALNSVINLVDRTNSVDLVTLMNYRITDECLSIFYPDGMLRKNLKSQIIANMNLEPFEPDPSYIAILDMGHIWRLAIPAVGETRPDSDAKFTWQDFGDRIATISVNRHANASTIICVNDPYDYENSTKDEERHRRAQGYGQIPNEFFKPDGEFPSRPKLARILSKDENKTRLQSFILKCKQAKLGSHNKDLLYSVGQSCLNVRTGVQEQNLQFHQSEADTIMFSIHHALRTQGVKDDIIFDTKDTDNYVSASYQAHLYNDRMGIKRGQEFINCSSLVEPNMVHHIIPLYVMTRMDQISGFFGHGKSTTYKKAQKSIRAKEQLEHCGEDEELEEECIQELLKFTRETVYGDNLSQTMGEARARKWRSQKKKSISRYVRSEYT